MKLDFCIETRGNIRVLRWAEGGCNSASAEECVLWDLLQSHEERVREAVAATLSAVDDKDNDWPKPAREAAHTAMGMFLRRLGEVDKGE